MHCDVPETDPLQQTHNWREGEMVRLSWWWAHNNKYTNTNTQIHNKYTIGGRGRWWGSSWWWARHRRSTQAASLRNSRCFKIPATKWHAQPIPWHTVANILKWRFSRNSKQHLILARIWGSRIGGSNSPYSCHQCISADWGLDYNTCASCKVCWYCCPWEGTWARAFFPTFYETHLLPLSAISPESRTKRLLLREESLDPPKIPLLHIPLL